MQIELEEHLVEELQQIAQGQGRNVNELVQEAVEMYIKHRDNPQEFEAMVDHLMKEHAWLLNELAKN